MFDEKLKISISNIELAKLFADAADEHDVKSKYYKESAEKVNFTPLEVEDEEWAPAYGNSIAKDISSSKKGMQTKAREHDVKAKQKRFIATHLVPNTQYSISVDVLVAWGVI